MFGNVLGGFWGVLGLGEFRDDLWAVCGCFKFCFGAILGCSGAFLRCFGSGLILPCFRADFEPFLGHFWGVLGLVQFGGDLGTVWDCFRVGFGAFIGHFWDAFGVFHICGSFVLVLTLFWGILGQFWGVPGADPQCLPSCPPCTPPRGCFWGSFGAFPPHFSGPFTRVLSRGSWGCVLGQIPAFLGPAGGERCGAQRRAGAGGGGDAAGAEGAGGLRAAGAPRNGGARALQHPGGDPLVGGEHQRDLPTPFGGALAGFLGVFVSFGGALAGFGVHPQQRCALGTPST